uniref:NADH dehydrogenase subunit 6 n=1 Tax=Eupelmus anpingensis TaxID=2989843 RepID=A0A9E7V2W8_9HYME|nr:NADH dehydrogenase subunit 6 [Eupelmus anpingensis]UYR45767.1 NADH dehydrogenase subunit 6 [Eupelmus anpingensis]
MLMIPSYNYNFHPLFYGIILFLYTLFTLINMSLNFLNNWFSYITFLILIGGLMIIFLYFTSFISNMKISMKWSFLKMIPFKNFMFILFIIINLIFNFNQFMSPMKINEMNSYNFMILNLKENYFFSFIFIKNKNLNIIMCMIYLLICLTFIVKICIIKKFTLRKIN